MQNTCRDRQGQLHFPPDWWIIDFMIANRPCPGCGGSGQISFFLGVSRFLLSQEECPECAGLGYLQPPPAESRPGGKECPGDADPDPDTPVAGGIGTVNRATAGDANPCSRGKRPCP